MKKISSKKLFKRLYLPYMIGWSISFIFFSIFRGVGTISTGTVKIEFSEGILLSLLIGPVCGLISAINQQYFEKLVNQRNISLNKLFLFKLLNSLFLLVFITLSCYAILFMIQTDFTGVLTFISQPESFVAYLNILITDTFFSLFRRVSILLGEEKVWKLLNGKYYAPKQEDKIFLFIDLKDSTSIAERIGHLKYSKLIQDTFNDIALIENYGGEIYQYIGDEIVFTWNKVTSKKAMNAVSGFIGFQKFMKQKSDYYISNYGFVPVFKAGIHGGRVTAVEVGKNKKEVAYHGDTINTTSRIQNECNTFNETLLISQTIADLIKDYPSFSLQKISSIKLRGKSIETSLYNVHLQGQLQKTDKEVNIALS